jgi:hypothetical protein
MPGPVGGDDDDTQLPSTSGGYTTGLPYPEQPASNMPNLPPSVVYPPAGVTGHTVPTTQYPPQPQSYPATTTQPAPVSNC